MIITSGDILESKCEVLVNPVNCMGVSGAGLAMKFRGKFPSAIEQYRKHCKENKVMPGSVLWFRPCERPWIWIACFATKNHWKDKSRLCDIEHGVRALSWDVVFRGVRSVAIPALGCGLGGLQWDDVKPVMINGLSSLTCNVVLYEPKGKQA